MKNKQIFAGVFALFTLLLLASCKEGEEKEFEKVLKNNSGYYYCADQCKLAYFKYSKDFWKKTSYSFDFVNDAMNSKDGGMTNMFATSSIFREQKSKFKIENGKVVSYTENENLVFEPVSVAIKNDNAAINFMKDAVLAKAENIVGAYKDVTTSRLYVIEKRDSKFILTVTYAEADMKPMTTAELKLTSDKNFAGDGYLLNFWADNLEIWDPVEFKGIKNEGGYTARFKTSK